MIYVEWLRVKRALKWTLISLGILLVLAGIGRLAAMRFMTDAVAQVDDLKSDKSSVVTTTVLPDGSKQTIIDNPKKHMHVTIVDRGYDGQHIEVLHQGPDEANQKPEMIYAGSIAVRTLPAHGGRLAVIDTNSATFFGDYSIIAVIISLIVATVLGAPFAREADGHLEVAATKPISREAFALQVLGVDALGIVLAYASGILFGFAAHAIFQAPHIVFGAADALAIAICILGSLAWYAMLTAATTSMRRGYGVILGFSWPIALLVVGFSFIPEKNAFATVVHQVFTFLSYIDPLRYLNLEGSSDTGEMILSPRAGLEPMMLAILAVVYSALAVIQWRRVEA